MAERDGLVRELHHRVKNNLQIIVSLINLQKRMLPADRQGEIRFLEEHVQAMAAAYRVVYASGELIEVPIDDLLREVVSGLVEVAGATTAGVETADCDAQMTINLDQAITLSLYLAVVLPPFLVADASAGAVRLTTRSTGDRVTIAIAGGPQNAMPFDSLRNRLIDGHLRQLGAVRGVSSEAVRFQISVPASALPH
ncbi:histidine kinase dimerization/phosphoacceptor domain -containing protein [Acidisoma cladoniae]|uniref:histidine kinase dimerization/phosphoacceptor domain -containing protein n=1 Tax=Acidisoma cladoniae TaxID=3040935 RepID=UPI0025510E1F|nr:histidine kinase dimerization/phosphoacceptor domain -containing protein [Acidisoma sp. PAMC 29798]